MSALRNKSGEKFSVKKFFVPVYIVVSLLFIVGVIYSYIVGTIYKGGMAKGQEQGYARAIQDLMSQAGKKCEPVALKLGEQKMDIINVGCFQKAENSQVQSESENK